MLPEAFYDQPGLEVALAGFEFGPVFRAVRAAQDWSQEALAEFLGCVAELRERLLATAA